MKKNIFFFYLIVILASCSRNPLNVNVSNVKVDLKIKHLEVDLLHLKKEQILDAIPALKSKYGDFFNIFTYRMIAIGGTDQENFPEMLNAFISDTLIQDLAGRVYDRVDTVKLRGELEMAFKHYKYYFPEKGIPSIFTCISGFNQSVVIAENLIGISLDKYMGSKSRYYVELGLPAYKRRNMCFEKIVPDMMFGWAESEWPKSDKANNLLSQMIHQGKIMYFLDAMFPEMDDTLKMGYTEKQLDFCKRKQASMWTYLAEHKELFSTDRMTIKRYIDDGPYTATFTDASPARTGVWLGWQIVRSYMKEHSEIKLAELLQNEDFQEILNQSGYQP